MRMFTGSQPVSQLASRSASQSICLLIRELASQSDSKSVSRPKKKDFKILINLINL